MTGSGRGNGRARVGRLQFSTFRDRPVGIVWRGQSGFQVDSRLGAKLRGLRRVFVREELVKLCVTWGKLWRRAMSRRVALCSQVKPFKKAQEDSNFVVC